jgi:uncharacterized membrane protein
MEQNLSKTRLQSLDVLRGAIMILMAIDHVRVYSGLPAGGQSPGIFFTRWVTHFCAPGFVFLAGAAIFLYGNKIKDKKRLAGFLLKRGLLLVLLELTLIRFSWTFNFNYVGFTLAGVIWMIGWCMVLMAALVRLKPMIVGIIGAFLIIGQQLFQYPAKVLPASLGSFWEFIYPSGFDPPPHISILYVLVPWIGVMAVGFLFGTVLLSDQERRRKICLWSGLTAIVLFIVIATIQIYPQPVENGAPPFIFRLLNQRKYPASSLYLLMTLGPLVALLPYAEKVKGRFVNILATFGKVPFFYYLAHIPLIHITALFVNKIRTGAFHQDWYNSAPYVFIEEAQRWPLGLLYILFFVDVLVLYFLCRWYSYYKINHPDKKWLRFV